MPEPRTSTQNRVALFFLIIGKALGVGGLVLGAVNRWAGGTLLLLDGIFILVAIGFCLRIGQRQKLQAQTDKQMLARMLREGTLRQYIREVERERYDEERALDAAAE